MKSRTSLTIPVAFICIILAHGSPPKSNRVGPPEIYPDPTMTPGAANPDVTQGNIQDKICSRLWSTKSIRPPAEYTSRQNVPGFPRFPPVSWQVNHEGFVELGRGNGYLKKSVSPNLWTLQTRSTG